MSTQDEIKFTLPESIEDGRLDTLLKLFYSLRENPSTRKKFCLNWQKVKYISPAGFALLACLFDTAVEQGCFVRHVFIKKSYRAHPVIKNLLELSTYQKLPPASIHNFCSQENILVGGANSLNCSFFEEVKTHCGRHLSDDLSFACQLILNELMQNSVDHSIAERYYLYAGRAGDEFHVGVLDMGITIPSKLAQKYSCNNDVDYLTLSLKEGISTRRARIGGLGLSHTFDLLKEYGGRLTLVSRNAQLRRYFKNKKIQKGPLKHALNGTWCFARFPDKRKK